MNELRADLSGKGVAEDSAVELRPAQVEEVLRALGAALRSYRLYAGSGPTLERFVEALQQKVRALWESTDRLRLEIGEQAIVWEGQKVFPTGDSGGELAFLFFKDGIREVTLLPGFEAEAHRLLAVLGRAPQVREEEDDLITLLWQEDFGSFKYQYVEPAPEGQGVEHTPSGPPVPIDAQAVRQAAQTPAAPEAAGLTADDFQETLYFLDDAELRQLREEVRKEAERDLWSDTMNALFDRLEDGSPERQLRIVHLFSELLPSTLGSGQLPRATALLRELAGLAARPGVLPPPVLREVRGVFGRLADPHTIEQLVGILEGAPDTLRSEALEELLGFFPPESLAPLTRAVEAVARPDFRRLLEGAVQRLAENNRDEVVRLLADADPTVVAGAARWVGSLGIGAATGDLGRLLRHAEPAVRVAAVDALVQLRAAVAGGGLVELLEDPEREVRVAAARALGALEYTAARGALEAAVHSKRLRAADRSEKIAFFEAFGRIGGAEAVGVLGKILNGKSWLGRGESTEDRACAALGLARIRHPSARAALTAAANDSDPVVRSAVGRALRGETS